MSDVTGTATLYGLFSKHDTDEWLMVRTTRCPHPRILVLNFDKGISFLFDFGLRRSLMYAVATGGTGHTHVWRDTRSDRLQAASLTLSVRKLYTTPHWDFTNQSLETSMKPHSHQSLHLNHFLSPTLGTNPSPHLNLESLAPRFYCCYM